VIFIPDNQSINCSGSTYDGDPSTPINPLMVVFLDPCCYGCKHRIGFFEALFKKRDATLESCPLGMPTSRSAEKLMKVYLYKS
jgi:hypothetical protein